MHHPSPLQARREEVKQQLGPAAAWFDAAARPVAALRDASGFRWVDLGAVFGSLAWR